MSDVEYDGMDEDVQQSKLMLGRLLSFSSHDLALAFLHRHRSRINRSLVKLLKDEVSSLVRVDVDRALAVADLSSEAARLIADPFCEALGCHARAMALYGSGKYVQALELYNRAQSIYRGLGLEVEAARVARAKMSMLMYLGRYSEAVQVANDARERLQQHGQQALVAQVDANLGVLYERLDQYQTALTYHQRAADVFERIGDHKSLAMVRQNLALVYSHLNEFERSLALYQQARQAFDELGLPLLALQSDHNVAWLYFLRGRFDYALKQFQRVEAEALKYGDVTQAAICQLDLAEVYLQLNAYEDALEAATGARLQFSQWQMNYELAKAHMYQSLANLHLGMVDQASAALQKARALFNEEGNDIYQALCDLYLSELAVKQDQWDQAIALCQAAGQIFEANQLEGKAAYTQFQLARIYFRSGDWESARESCRRSLQTMASLEAPWLKYQCYHLNGNLAEHFGHTPLAYQSYQQAIRHVEEMRGTIRIDEFKTTFVKDKLMVYEDLVRLCLKDGSRAKLEEAFQHVEAAKSRALVDLMSGSLPIKADPTADVALAERWNVLREELDWHYNRLNEFESRSGPRSIEVGQQMRRAIREREMELAKLLRQLQVQHPEYSSLQTVSHIRCEDVARDLTGDEVLLEYYTIGEDIVVFVIDSSGLRVAHSLSSTDQVLDQLRKLRFQLNKHLFTSDYVTRHQEELLEHTNDHLQSLYESLIEPVAWALDRPNVIIVPHGILHYIPFHALYDGQAPVIDQFVVSYAPSAHTLGLCRKRRSVQSDGRVPALIVGVPDVGLPYIEQEVNHIRSLIPGAETLVGDQASLDQFRWQAERCRFLHLASHAVFRQDNPLFSALKLSNSWLNFYDVFHLDLQAELVTLSACQTGVSKVFGGDELVGLMRGFLYAGAPSMILSLWAVNDQSTAELMGELYRRLGQGQGARHALRDAQLAIRERYPHPYFWAPFVLMGSP